MAILAVDKVQKYTVTGVELNPQEELAMKRLIASVVLAVALLTSGAVVTQSRSGRYGVCRAVTRASVGTGCDEVK